MCRIASRADTGPLTSWCPDARATPRHFPENFTEMSSDQKYMSEERDHLEEVWPADIVHGAPGVEPVVAILALQGRAQVNSLGPVKVRSDILQLGLVAPVLGLRREENLSHGLVSDKLSNIVKF